MNAAEYDEREMIQVLRRAALARLEKAEAQGPGWAGYTLARAAAWRLTQEAWTLDMLLLRAAPVD